MVPSWALIAPAKYLKWSTVRGISAANPSLIGFPLSNVSASASFSVFSSILSAIFNKIFALSAGPVFPQAGAALCAASNAKSISSAFDLGTSHITFPDVGEIFSKYFPDFGFCQSPPIKFSYLELGFNFDPSSPG